MKPINKLWKRIDKISDERLREEIKYLIVAVLIEQRDEMQALLSSPDPMIVK